jgi:hypothetical protein
VINASAPKTNRVGYVPSVPLNFSGNVVTVINGNSNGINDASGVPAGIVNVCEQMCDAVAQQCHTLVSISRATGAMARASFQGSIAAASSS